MTEETPARMMYHEELVEQWKERIAPFRKNFWNKIAKAVDTSIGAGAVALGIVVTVMLAIALLHGHERAGLPAFLLVILISLAVHSDRWAHKPPKWSRASLTELMRTCDKVLPPEHPLRQAVASGLLAPIAPGSTRDLIEFELETLGDLVVGKFPETYILWRGYPLKKDKQDAILLVHNTTVHSKTLTSPRKFALRGKPSTT